MAFNAVLVMLIGLALIIARVPIAKFQVRVLKELRVVPEAASGILRLIKILHVLFGLACLAIGTVLLVNSL